MPNTFRILKPIQKSSKCVRVFRNANAFAKNQTRLAYEDKRDLYCICGFMWQSGFMWLSGFKSIGTYLYSRSVAKSNMKLIGALLMKLWSAQAFSSYFHKMAVGGHFGFPIIAKIDRVLPL